MPKEEFPPLLGAGFHSVTVERLRTLCVADFVGSATRAKIMDSLASAIERVQAGKFPAEMWIDGSFLTKKIDPSDVDLALIIPAHVQMAATPQIRATLEWIESDETYDRELLDGRVLTMHPASSPMFPKWEATRQYWELLFGTEHDDVTPKGVAFIRFRGGV